MDKSNSILAPGETAPAKKIDPRNLLSGLGLGVTTAVAFGLGGFFLIYDATGAMGSVLFIALPLATGFATGLVARSWNLVLASVIVGLIICSACLIATGKEGWVCVLMSAPLIGLALAVGAMVGALFRNHVISRFKAQGAMTLLAL